MPKNINELDNQMERITKIFNSDEAPCVTDSTLSQYLDYLRENITFPCELTGIEDFMWEEFYVLVPGDSDEYEELKKTKPSYTDTFQLMSFEDDPVEHEGILGEVKRIKGVNNKEFVLGLDWLKCTDKTSKNYQLLDDYSVWFVNYR